MLYYLNPNKSLVSEGSNYEVHSADCLHCNNIKSSLKVIGNFNNAKDAIIAAKQRYLYLAVDIEGCPYCTNENQERN